MTRWSPRRGRALISGWVTRVAPVGRLMYHQGCGRVSLPTYGCIVSPSRLPCPLVMLPCPPNGPPEHSDDELDAAFDGSDDELDYDDDNAPVSESQPLNPSRSGRTSPPLPTQNHPPPIAIPGAYDFERVDYDVPPPGSPTRAMANDYGNTNGHVPSFDTDVDFTGARRGGARSWFSRTAANVLPSHYVHRLGLGGPSTQLRM
jgi:hypothetical protein